MTEGEKEGPIRGASCAIHVTTPPEAHDGRKGDAMRKVKKKKTTNRQQILQKKYIFFFFEKKK